MLKQPLAADSEPVPYRFSVEDWHWLGVAAILRADRKMNPAAFSAVVIGASEVIPAR